MAMADVKTSTPKIPQGFRCAHEVTAAGGGRVTVGNQLAKGERKPLWLDPDTGEWREFSEAIPHYDPHFFRTSTADSIFETGLWRHMLRRPVRTYKGLDWSGCQYKDCSVVVSILPTDEAVTTVSSKPNLPPPVATTAKQRARMDPPQWLVAPVACLPEQKGESRAKYFERLEGKMRQELKDRAVWKAVHIGRKAYEFELLPRRQPRVKKTKNSH